VGQHLLRQLAENGHRARGLIRNPDHAADLERLGAEAVVCDLEQEDDISGCVEGADAVVFAAGAGPGSGAERKKTVDLGGAVKLIEACHKTGIRRYVIVSSIGADDPSAGSEQMRAYLEAKHDADVALEEAGLDHTIVRPGMLTDDPGTGQVSAGPDVQRAEIPREDVAAVVAAALELDDTIGKTFVLVSGDTPIEEALRSL
jgi:uncharacterized protein YbjT (DUF2867 family)